MQQQRGVQHIASTPALRQSLKRALSIEELSDVQV